jgi:GT2 family glycosyltransferase
MKGVTVILTCCNRVDLLRRTLDSFFEMNTYPITEFHAHNDGDDRLFKKIYQQYPQITWQFSGQRIGYARSLDKLFSKVNTEYVFSTEEDWSYYKNPGFIERSMKILEENENVNQVWIRDLEDHGHPQGPEIEISGIKVREVLTGYRKIWNGFSLNPSLRRMSDIRKFFPNGLSKCGDGDEATLALHTAKFNYKAVSLVESTIKHIGYNRRSMNFKP